MVHNLLLRDYCISYCYQSPLSASLAQWLEHWSRKPGVVSSSLTRGIFCIHETVLNVTLTRLWEVEVTSASVAQWL